MVCDTRLGQAVLWHMVTFNEEWITNVVSENKALWIDLRRNAVAKARTYLREIADRADKDGVIAITSGLWESASYLTHYRGSMCGAEISLRLAIQIYVLVKAIQDIQENAAQETLERIALEHNCPEITDYAFGATVR